jgi:hypothetical protein
LRCNSLLPPPGQPLPPDVIIEIGSYVLAQLDDVGLAVLSSALYDAFRSFVARSHRVAATFDIKIFKRDDKSERHIHVTGEAYSGDTIKQLIEQAVDDSSQTFGEDD